MHPIAAQLAHHGAPLVFGNVLLQQIGVPIPAEPTLVVAGSLAAKGLLSPAAIVTTTLAAALLADTAWFLLGRRYQTTVLGLVGRLTRSRGGIGASRETFARWGVKSMLLAKFLPGVSQVMVPVAGATGATYRSFIFYDVLGTLLWASLPIGAGMLFNQQVDAVLAAMSRIAIWLFLGALVGAATVVVARVRRQGAGVGNRRNGPNLSDTRSTDDEDDATKVRDLWVGRPAGDAGHGACRAGQ